MPTIVDDFEGDLSAYSKYDNETDKWVTQSDVVKVGSKALEWKNDTWEGTTKIGSTSGLNAYPERGDVFQFWVRKNLDGISAQFQFATTGTDIEDESGYGVRFNSNNGLSLMRWDNGSANVLVDDEDVGTTNEWYQIRVAFGSSALSDFVFDRGDPVQVQSGGSDLTFIQNDPVTVSGDSDLVFDRGEGIGGGGTGSEIEVSMFDEFGTRIGSLPPVEDDTHDTGGIGFKISTQDTDDDDEHAVYWDEVEIL